MARKVLVVLAIVATALAAGCGGDDEGGGEAGGRTKVRVGLLPLAAVAPVYIGVEQGFFAEEGLDVEPKLTQGGAAVVPAVTSGDFQFGYSNNVSLLVAAAQGVPLKIVAEGNQEAGQRAHATDAVVVKRGSSIKSAKDLAGKTIGVNTLKNVGEVAIKTALQKRGVDVSSLRFVEIPFPDMVPAVDAGRIDAGWVVEPFVQAAKAAGMRILANPFIETDRRLSIATYFTSARYAQENPDVVRRFARALGRAFEYTQAHPAALRKSVLEFTKTPKAVADAMELPFFTSALNRASIELTARKMVEFGVIDDEPPLDELLP